MMERGLVWSDFIPILMMKIAMNGRAGGTLFTTKNGSPFFGQALVTWNQSNSM